ncbi:MAG: glycosyltransferase family 4 protein [Patescibacteria group bacterium]
MKIAMIGQKGIPAIHGGVERHVHDLSLNLAKKGHEVFVYSRKWYTNKNEDYNIENVKIIHKPSLHTKHLDTITHTFFATIDAIKKENKIDVIHYHGVGPSLLAFIPRIFSPKIKVISTFHSIDRYHQKWNFLAKTVLRLGERAACKFPHQTITVSRSLENYSVNEYKAKTIYIPNAVNSLDEMPNYEEILRADNLKKFNLEKGKYLVMISRLVPHKGAHILIQAFVNLKNKYKDDPKIQELKLAIVGGSVFTDKYVRDLHVLASSQNDIIFTDFQSGNILEELYSGSLALVNPSMSEGLPITVLQAMSHKKPVLVSNIAEHLELVKNPKYIFNENDIEDLENKLFDFLCADENGRSLEGEQNLKTVNKYYTWENIAPQIIKVYNS